MTILPSIALGCLTVLTPLFPAGPPAIRPPDPYAVVWYEVSQEPARDRPNTVEVTYKFYHANKSFVTIVRRYSVDPSGPPFRITPAEMNDVFDEDLQRVCTLFDGEIEYIDPSEGWGTLEDRKHRD